MKKFGFLFCALLTSLSAAATEIVPIFTAGYEAGGDTLVDFVYTDGSHSKIKAGQGFLLGVGTILRFAEGGADGLELQANAGLKFDSTKQSKNGDLTFYRWPLELFSFYRTLDSRLRFGAGVIYQVGNKLDGTDLADILDTRVKNSLGGALQVDYFFGWDKNIGVGARYTFMRYEPKDFPGPKINGDSFGVVVSLALEKSQPEALPAGEAPEKKKIYNEN